MKDRSNIGGQLTARHRFLCLMAGDLSGKEILDLGCGFGWFEDYAVKKGCSRVVGVDLDEAELMRAAKEVPGADFLNRDVTELTGDIGSFDVICMFDFLEHLPRVSTANTLIECARHLNSCGRVLISVPYRGILSTAMDPAYYFGHRHYRMREIEALLKDADLVVSRVYYAGGLWEQIAMIWLYLFKWVFGRQMPLKDFLERKRAKEYAKYRDTPGISSCVTMFVEAGPA